MKTGNKKRNRTMHFLIGSFSLLLVVSAVAFLCLGWHMSRANNNAINEVGNLYMVGINEQMSAHFRTLVNLKLEQAQAVVTVVSEDTDNKEEMYEELVYRAKVRNFDHLALCSEDGKLEMLYGERITADDPDPFFRSLERGEHKVAVGTDKAGRKVVLFGVAADYPMSDGGRSMALVTAMPMEYINLMLHTDGENALMYSYIIRKDGSFIASELSGQYPDYFSSLYDRYKDREQISRFIEELTAAMEKKEDYSTVVDFSGTKEQVYCASLPYSEWQLVTVLPFGNLDQTVEKLGQSRTKAMMLVFMIILVALLFIFYVYYRMNCRQLEELEHARQDALQATKAKSEFLSNMSHDIRTPMNAIVGMTAIAMAHMDDKDQLQNCLKKITISGKHLLGLINDVLDISKIESGKMTLTAELVSLREVVDGLVSIVQTQIKGKGQQFNVQIDNIQVEDVYCDSVRLNQVLLNLLSNAVKYTQEGGTIQLLLYQEDPPKDSEKYVRTHVIVKDNGIGMTAEFLEHIFDSYSRADNKRVQKTEGTGLGMSITKYIVDAMGGTITVESAPQKGSKFHLTVDLEKATVPEVDMILPPWRMLVVDDDEMLCRTALDALDSIGISADWTTSGEKALEMVESRHQQRSDYEIVLLDWKLQGTDGLEVAKQIRQIIDDEVTVILISAYDWSGYDAEAKEAGIAGFLSKPLFKSTLYYGLKKYMGMEEEEVEDRTDLDLSGRHILVAEDNEINWEVLKELLSDVGMDLEWAENGRICLEKFQQAKQGYYDAILMDVRMPVMNGYEATEAIRALERADAQEIPIIAMTADAFAEDIQRCLDSGMNAHTAKPIDLDKVVFLLKKYIVK